MNKRLFIITILLSFIMISGCSNNSQEQEQLSIQENSIYRAPVNPTQPQIKVFNELSESLKNSDQPKKIAEMVAVNFVYDFFSMFNKSSKDEVGGLQFLPSEKQEEFQAYAKLKYYDNYDAIVAQYGKESLPNVILHEVKSVVEQKLLYNQLTYDGYVVNLEVKYQESKFPQDVLKTQMSVQVILNEGVYQVIAVEDIKQAQE